MDYNELKWEPLDSVEAAKPEEPVSWGDEYSAVTSGAKSLGATAAAGTRYLTDEPNGPAAAFVNGASKFLQGELNKSAEEDIEGMGTTARRRLEAAVTSPDFYMHPFSSGLLKTLNMTPALGAAIVGGLVAGPVGAMGTMGGLTAGQVLNEIDKSFDLPDEKLREVNPFYASLRDMGDDEETARTYLKDKATGLKPLIGAVVGAAAGAFGPGAIVGRGAVVGAAERGVLGRAGIAGAENFAGGAAQAGATDVLVQQARVDTGMQPELDVEAIINEALTGGAMGVVPGAAVGAIAGGRRQSAIPESTMTGRATAPAPKPVEVAGVGNQESAPTRSATSYPKSRREGGRTSQEVVETVDAGAPDVAQTEALQQKTSTATPVASRVGEAADVVPAPAAPRRGLPSNEKPLVTPEDVQVGDTSEVIRQPKVTQPEEPILGQKEQPQTVATEPKLKWEPIKTELPEATPEVTTPRQPRVLESQTPEARANLEKQNLAINENMQGATQPEVPAGPKRVHRSKAQLAKKEQDAENIKNIFEKEDTQDIKIPGNAAERTNLIGRLTAISNMADELKVKVPAKVGYEGTADHIVWLRDVRDTLKVLNNKKAWNTKKAAEESTTRVANFLMDWKAAREGDFQPLRDRRKVEGDIRMRKSQGDVEAPTKVDLSHKETPEDILIGREEGEIEKPAGRERQIVVQKGPAYETPKAPREPVVVKSKREVLKEAIAKSKEKKAVTAAADEAFARAKPIIEAGEKADYRLRNRLAANKLARAAKEEVTPEGNKPTKVKAEPKRTPAEEAELAKLMAEQEYEMRPTDLMRGEGSEFLSQREKSGEHVDFRTYARGDDENLRHVKFQATETSNVKGMLRRTTVGEMRGVPRYMAAYVKGRLADKVGNIKVHLVEPEDMSRSLGRDTLGFYHPGSEPGKAQIFIDRSTLSDQGLFNHVLLHESIHAAVNDAIEGSTDHHTMIRMMMDDAARARADEGLTGNPYFLKNQYEFIAEAMSNPEFQDWLSRQAIDRRIAAELGLGEKRTPTMWDMFVAFIRRTLGLGKNSHTMLEGVLRVSESLIEGRRGPWERTDPLNPRSVTPRRLVHADALRVANDVRDIFRAADEQLQNRPPLLLKLRTFDQVAQAADNFFGRENNPVRIVADKIEQIRVGAQKYLAKSEPVITKLYELERKYKGKQWDDFTTLVHDETVANVYADRPLDAQKHLGKDRLDTKWAKSRYKDLHDRWAALPQDLKDARLEATKFFSDRQNAMSLGLINNRILPILGVRDGALAKRIHEGSVTDADRKLLGPDLDLIEEAGVFSKIQGPYFPLMRRGNYVVRGRTELSIPKGGKLLDESTVEFKSRDEAVAYAESQDMPSKVSSAWVDAKSGEKYVKDPQTGEEIRISKNDVDAEQRFRVKVQNEHVEFFEKKDDALRSAGDLEKSGMKVKGVVVRKYEYDRSADMVSTQLETLARAIEKRDNYRDYTPAMKADLMAALNEAAARNMASTRIQSSRLPRRNVAGYSKDLTKNTYDYALSTSHYLSKLDHAPDLEAAMAQMNKMADGDFAKENSLGRSTIAHEVNKRVYENNSFAGMVEGTKLGQYAHRLMLTSFLDKLFSPSASVINATQPAMVTMPYLSGRHGVVRSMTALSKAYNDIGGLGLLKAGVKETGRKIAGGAETHNYVDDVKAKLRSAEERELIDYAVDRGSLDPDAGLEIGSLIKQHEGLIGRLDKGLGYMSGVARQMPRAIETINRASTLLAAFRLERSRGASKEQAFRYAQEAVNNTQFQYSNTNAAPVFNHPLAKLSFQFKKYGQGMYHLLGQQVGKAIRNANPGDRAEAIKTLTMIVGTHTAVVGALGLPTEPLKYMIMGANAVGLTGLTWEDVENYARKEAAGALGKTGGELLTRGLARPLGGDISTRMGLDNLTSFGEPKSYKPDDVKAWLFDHVGGAPVGMLGDWMRGANALATGDFGKASELMIPMKLASDSIRAYRQGTEGKKSQVSGRQVSEPYSAAEAVTRAIGFTPTREAREGEKFRAFKSQSDTNQKIRSEMIKNWVEATDRAKAWAEIRKWNATQPKDNRIQPKDLTAAKTRKKNEAPGIQTSRRNEHIKSKLDQVYQ